MAEGTKQQEPVTEPQSALGLLQQRMALEPDRLIVKALARTLNRYADRINSTLNDDLHISQRIPLNTAPDDPVFLSALNSFNAYMLHMIDEKGAQRTQDFNGSDMERDRYAQIFDVFQNPQTENTGEMTARGHAAIQSYIEMNSTIVKKGLRDPAYEEALDFRNFYHNSTTFNNQSRALQNFDDRFGIVDPAALFFDATDGERDYMYDPMSASRIPVNPPQQTTDPEKTTTPSESDTPELPQDNTAAKTYNLVDMFQDSIGNDPVIMRRIVAFQKAQGLTQSAAFDEQTIEAARQVMEEQFGHYMASQPGDLHIDAQGKSYIIRNDGGIYARDDSGEFNRESGNVLDMPPMHPAAHIVMKQMLERVEQQTLDDLKADKVFTLEKKISQHLLQITQDKKLADDLALQLKGKSGTQVDELLKPHMDGKNISDDYTISLVALLQMQQNLEVNPTYYELTNSQNWDNFSEFHSVSALTDIVNFFANGVSHDSLYKFQKPPAPGISDGAYFRFFAKEAYDQLTEYDAVQAKFLDANAADNVLLTRDQAATYFLERFRNEATQAMEQNPGTGSVAELILSAKFVPHFEDMKYAREGYGEPETVSMSLNQINTKLDKQLSAAGLTRAELDAAYKSRDMDGISDEITSLFYAANLRKWHMDCGNLADADTPLGKIYVQGEIAAYQDRMFGNDFGFLGDIKQPINTFVNGQLVEMTGEDMALRLFARLNPHDFKDKIADKLGIPVDDALKHDQLREMMASSDKISPDTLEWFDQQMEIGKSKSIAHYFQWGAVGQSDFNLRNDYELGLRQMYLRSIEDHLEANATAEKNDFTLAPEEVDELHEKAKSGINALSKALVIQPDTTPDKTADKTANGLQQKLSALFHDHAALNTGISMAVAAATVTNPLLMMIRAAGSDITERTPEDTPETTPDAPTPEEVGTAVQSALNNIRMP